MGPGVTDLAPADELYGVTNSQFCGAQAEFAVATAGMVARKPQSLSHVEAASAPVIAVTAWQMLFRYAKAIRGQTAMVVGAAGNVGAYAVQMALDAGIRGCRRRSLQRRKTASFVGREIHYRLEQARIRAGSSAGGSILDTVGGSTFQRCIAALKPGGKLVTSVLTQPLPAGAVFFYAEVTTARLQTLTQLFDEGRLKARVGSILPLSEARQAQTMLAGAPHKPGKIVLEIGTLQQNDLKSADQRNSRLEADRPEGANITSEGRIEMKKEQRGINPVSRPSGDGCVECLASREGWWFHLRRCAECGRIGCCDSSPSQHASRHAAAAGHPIIASFEPGEDWFFDYEKQEMIQGVELLPPHSHPKDQPAPGPAGRVPADWESLLN